MQITQEQLKLLDGWSCHRLSKKDEHKYLIFSFENRRNPNLVDSLRRTAWNEDEEGSTAYYLVKDEKNTPLFFFSLKCGALYQHLDEAQIKERKKAYNLAKRLINNPQIRKRKI